MLYLLRINPARNLGGAYRNGANVLTWCRHINASTVSSKRWVQVAINIQ